jgi:hypothetical protein
VSGHLYSAGDTFDSPGFFDRLRVLLANVQRKTKARQVRQVFMTEYASLKVHRDRDPLLLARTIYETLTRVDAGMYLHWDVRQLSQRAGLERLALRQAPH